MGILKDNIKRIMCLMEVKSSVEIDDTELDDEEVNQETELGEEEVNEEGDAPADTGSSITPWESGVKRDNGNPITSAKREDKTGRSKGNMLGKAGEKWSSGRNFGKTGKYKT